MLRQYELVERVKAYDPDADEAMLNHAYVYTVQKHGSQKRASGDPYFSHPVEVAGLMTDLKLDQETIATALLHDTVEDTLATIDDIEKHFGKDVARLVDGVTKLSKIEQMPENERAAENLRKFLLAMSEDIRVLLVKLGDRLYSRIRILDHDEKRFHTFQELYHEDGWLSATGEGLTLHVDLGGPKVAPMPEHIQHRLAELARAHARLPAPEGVGSRIGIRRKAASG